MLKRILPTVALLFGAYASAQTVSYQIGPSFCGETGFNNLYCYNVDLKNAVGPGQDAYIWIDTVYKAPPTEDFIAWRGYFNLDQAAVTLPVMTSNPDPVTGSPQLVVMNFTGIGYSGTMTLELSYTKRGGRYGGFNCNITGGVITIKSLSAGVDITPHAKAGAITAEWSPRTRKLPELLRVQNYQGPPPGCYNYTIVAGPYPCFCPTGGGGSCSRCATWKATCVAYGTEYDWEYLYYWTVIYG